MKHVIIFGAGPSGLYAAHELIKKGYRVTIYESQKYLGVNLSPGKRILLWLVIFFKEEWQQWD